MYKTPVVSSALLLTIATLLAGCTNEKETHLNGRFRRAVFEDRFIEFFSDGTFANEELSGSYNFLEDGRLKFTSTVFGTSQVVVYDRISKENGLLIMEQSGKGLEVYLEDSGYSQKWSLSDEPDFQKLIGEWKGKFEAMNGDELVETYEDESQLLPIQWFGISAIEGNHKIKIGDKEGQARTLILPTSRKGYYLNVLKLGGYYSYTIQRDSGRGFSYESILPKGKGFNKSEGGFIDENNTRYTGTKDSGNGIVVTTKTEYTRQKGASPE